MTIMYMKDILPMMRLGKLSKHLDNPVLSGFRVTERVTDGGHYVDPKTLRDNFYDNLVKLNEYHNIIDNLTIVDTSEINHKILFKRINHQVEFFEQREELPNWFTEYLSDILQYVP